MALRFIVLGDWGTGDSDQARVANAMAEYADENTVDFIVATGDNFYPYGVYSATDEQFSEKWRNVYNQRSLKNLRWYISVGNHDHTDDDGREYYQVPQLYSVLLSVSCPRALFHLESHNLFRITVVVADWLG